MVLDTGCTRSMGSCTSVERFLIVALEHGYWYRLLPCLSLASAHTDTVSAMVEIYFPTKPKPPSTNIFIFDDGDVPILMSLDQVLVCLQRPGRFSLATGHLDIKSRRYTQVLATT